MSFLTSHHNEIRYGVIVDIGSGSVLASIIESDPAQAYPKIIWSKREYTPLRQVDTLNRTVKSIMTTLIGVMMTLDSEGRQVLRKNLLREKISYLQFTIAAPWSYTVAKTISYSNEEEFVVTENFVDELLRMAEQKVLEELKENEEIHKLDLSLISRITADIVANGYSIDLNGKQKAKSLKVVELNAITNESIVKEIEEVREKMFPRTDLTLYSFMMPFFYTILDLYSNTIECCLVDVTYEATEIGIVRDGVLQYCSHTPYGSISLAREISTILSVTLDEAHSYLEIDDLAQVLEKYSQRQRDDVEAVFEAYRVHLVSLLKETGDKLSVPKSLFLHTSLDKANFFKKHLLESANIATKSSHVVYNVTGDLLTKHYPKEEQGLVKSSRQDTAMLISAQFFHTRNYARQFEQL
ncbi:MAG: hypothetical protein UZ19_OD1000255 [Parcubacteria bacterium OLB19]|nr:MAG: hypothetical protein UZ19_OD1000255 [Parcubacteria bacterium OLB19]